MHTGPACLPWPYDIFTEFAVDSSSRFVFEFFSEHGQTYCTNTDSRTQKLTTIHRPWLLTPACIMITMLSLNSTTAVSSRGSSWHPRRHITRHADILARMSACRATFPFSLPRAYLIGRPAVCCRVCAARLSVCRVVLQIPWARYAQLVVDILARTLLGNCSRRISAYSSSQTHFTATGTHLPYGIIQCYLPPGEVTFPLLPQPIKGDLATPEQCKAELT